MDSMSKLGGILKEAREELGYDYDKVTGDIRLSADIIEQIEDGGFLQLPSYNHAKNFVKNYAEYLGLDVTAVMQMLAEECTKTDFSHEPITVATEEPLEEIVKSDNNPAAVKYVIIGLIILAVIVAGTFLVRSGHKTKPAEEQVSQTVDQPLTDEKPEKEDNEFNTVDKKILEETINSVNASEQADAKAAEGPITEDGHKPVTTDEKTPEEAKAAAAKALEKPLPAGMQRAILNFSDVCWVHFKSDTGEELDFIADRANHKEITFKNHFFLDIGNAAVASVTYNGKVIAGLGGYKVPVKGLKFEPNPENGSLKYSIVK